MIIDFIKNVYFIYLFTYFKKKAFSSFGVSSESILQAFSYEGKFVSLLK